MVTMQYYYTRQPEARPCWTHRVILPTLWLDSGKSTVHHHD